MEKTFIIPHQDSIPLLSYKTAEDSTFVRTRGRIPLKTPTHPLWIETVLGDFNKFLINHAACERKASATALSFVVKYRDRKNLVATMIEIAIEELQHFQEVHTLLEKRSLQLGADEHDTYIKLLFKEARNSPEQRFLDRLLMSAIIEARGCERFGLVGKHHTDPDLASYYENLSRTEAKHQLLFIQLAEEYFETKTIAPRLEELLCAESKILSSLPIHAALY